MTPLGRRGIWAPMLVAAGLALAGPADGQIPDKTLGGVRELPPGPAPTGVAVRAVHPTEALVTWQPASGATGYNVLRSAAPGSPFYAVNDPALSATLSSFADRGLTPKSTVAYQVQAVYPLLQSSPGTSAAVSVTLPPAVQPASLSAVASGSDAVELSWPAPAGATSFAVMRLSGGSWKSLNGGQLVRGSGYKDSGLGPGTHTYRVIAYYQIAGKGEMEGELTGIPEASVSVGRRSGRYQVVLDAFTVQRPTQDDPFQSDGKGDEVFLGLRGVEIHPDIKCTSNGVPKDFCPSGRTVDTSVFGDRARFPERVRAGTAGAKGGLVRGDRVPESGAASLGIEVWRGELIEGKKVVLLTPTVWEWDDQRYLSIQNRPVDQPYLDWQRASRAADTYLMDSGRSGQAALLVQTTTLEPPELAPYTGYLTLTWPDDWGNRAIGVHRFRTGRRDPLTLYEWHYRFVPQTRVLSVGSVEGLLAGGSTGAFDITYTDSDEIWRPPVDLASYTLHFKVFRLP